MARQKGRIFVKPVGGRSVPDVTGEIIPDEGMWVEDDIYTHRRFAEGAIKEAEPPAEEAPARKSRTASKDAGEIT